MSLLPTATLALNPLDPHSLPASLVALGVFLVLFAETGLLIGFFLPGDSLLFSPRACCARPTPARIPGIDRYLLPIIAVIVLVSLLPVAAEVWRAHHRPPDRSPRPDATTADPIASEEGRQ